MESICPIIYDKDQYFQTSGWPARILLFLFTTWAAIPAVLMLRLILPFEVDWYSWTKIEIRRSRLSHQERASKRIASQISPSLHFMVSLNVVDDMTNQFIMLRYLDRLWLP